MPKRRLPKIKDERINGLWENTCVQCGQTWFDWTSSKLCVQCMIRRN